eukprot:s41_g25.t1
MSRWFRLVFSAAAGTWSAAVEVTDWQKEVISKVEATAAELSQAAVPKLLAKLDSSSFRDYLQECCPSVAQLPASELLQRLNRHMEAAEIVSGFPAVIDPAQMYPDSAGMSVDYGLNGSLFLNDWQAVLLHSTDPPEVWHNVTLQFTDASCDMERQMVSVGIFPHGCGGQRWAQNYSLGKCYSQAENVVQSYNCSEGKLTEIIWMLNQNETGKTWRWKSHTRSRFPSYLSEPNSTVPCPQQPPLSATTSVADGKCHGIAVQNNTDSWRMQDHAETYEYALKPFEDAGAPKSMEEADERPVYSLVNNNLIDQGSPIYGDVSAVFSSKFIAGGALLSPMDTGFVETTCVEHHDFPWAPHFNCSAYSHGKVLGTVKHHNHLFLINEDFWGNASSLRSILMRMEGAWGSHPMPGLNFLNYFEAAVLGRLELPISVRFLIGEFPTLFGTDLGERLQQWARKSGRVLVWTLGPNNQPKAARPSASAPAFNFDLMSSSRSFRCNQRILDPLVLADTTAAESLDAATSDTSDFQKLWAQVACCGSGSDGCLSWAHFMVEKHIWRFP